VAYFYHVALFLSSQIINVALVVNIGWLLLFLFILNLYYYLFFIIYFLIILSVTINIKTIDNNENINSNSKKNKDNNDIIENSGKKSNKRNNNKNIKEVINNCEYLKVEIINNRTNKFLTPSLVIESKVIINKNSKINNIQIIPNDNKNKQFTNKVYSVNNNIYIKERKIINKNSPIDESSKVVNVGSDKKIKINKIKNNIKIPPIGIQNIGKNKININKLMMPKPEIVLKDIIIYSKNRVDTKRTIRNYRYKRK